MVISSNVDKYVDQIVDNTQVYDIHTHLYDPAFGNILLWGIDELLVYHYLVAEGFRFLEIPYEAFWKLSKEQQADILWDALFVQNSPVSEACRGVLTTLNKLGLDTRKRDLSSIRKWFKGQRRDQYVSKVMELARVKTICMTNSPFDDQERPIWEKGYKRDDRFTSALRIDPLLCNWEATVPKLKDWGYAVTPKLTPKTISEVRRFLADWTKKMQALYVMVSLEPHFRFPAGDDCAQLIEKAVIPHCEEFNIPFAMMPGVRRLINPELRLAGDGVGYCDVPSYQTLFASYPKVKFLITALSRENLHEFAVVARKFRNLHLFGCWWFTNVPVLIEEIIQLRIEMLGTSFTMQHSDARVLDQLIYKWEHSRIIVSRILKTKYQELVKSGWDLSPEEIQRDVQNWFGGSFEAFLKKSF
jgi:hypothetical protein